MKKRAISLALAVMLICGISVCAYADSAINEARHGVVYIEEYVYFNGRVAGAWSGTGFFVGNTGEAVKYLVTNCHVVENYLEYGAGAVVDARDQYGNRVKAQSVLRVYFDSEEAVEAYVLDYNPNQDIAILKLEEDTEERSALPLRIPADDMVGDAMYVVGYPGSNELLSTTSALGPADSIVAKGTIGRLITESASGNRWISSTDIDIHHGNSGGPILDESGAVIGVACMGIADDNEQVNYCVNTEAVVEMLRRNEVPYELVKDTVEEPTATEMPVPTPAPTAAPSPAAKETGISPVVLAVVAVAALAVVIAMVLITKVRKAEKPNTAAPEVINKTVAAAPLVENKKLSPVVRSLASQHNRQKAAIKSDPIIIGRTKECAIVFKDGTPGVSSKHCAVTWDAVNGVFVLKDMNSTYGTFLDSGMKLDPNRVYRLKAGERFYLGDKANMLQVELD